MKTGISTVMLFVATMVGLCASGCGDADHDESESLGKVVASLEAEFAKIQDAFAKNDVAAADEPVHEVGHILEHFKELADKASLNDEQKAAVSTATEELFTHFGELDKQIHAGADVEFTDLEPKISAALAALKAAIQDEG